MVTRKGGRLKVCIRAVLRGARPAVSRMLGSPMNTTRTCRRVPGATHRSTTMMDVLHSKAIGHDGMRVRSC
jgi:hypothetical protein